MTEEILKLAKECGFADWYGTDDVEFLKVIEAFYRAVEERTLTKQKAWYYAEGFSAGIDAAAWLAYGTGDEHMEAQIRALKEMK